jgi:hypothetical protein
MGVKNEVKMGVKSEVNLLPLSFPVSLPKVELCYFFLQR